MAKVYFVVKGGEYVDAFRDRPAADGLAEELNADEAIYQGCDPEELTNPARVEVQDTPEP